MKTAEEWVDLETGHVYFHAREDAVSDEAWIELVKLIQLDAYKAGMTKAACIVLEKSVGFNQVDNNKIAELLDDLDNTILTVRDNKTSL